MKKIFFCILAGGLLAVLKILKLLNNFFQKEAENET